MRLRIETFLLTRIYLISPQVGIIQKVFFRNFRATLRCCFYGCVNSVLHFLFPLQIRKKSRSYWNASRNKKAKPLAVMRQVGGDFSTTLFFFFSMCHKCDYDSHRGLWWPKCNAAAYWSAPQGIEMLKCFAAQRVFLNSSQNSVFFRTCKVYFLNFVRIRVIRWQILSATQLVHLWNALTAAFHPLAYFINIFTLLVVFALTNFLLLLKCKKVW